MFCSWKWRSVHNVPLMGERQSIPQSFCVDFESWLEDASMKSLPDLDETKPCVIGKRWLHMQRLHIESQPWLST